MDAPNELPRRHRNALSRSDAARELGVSNKFLRVLERECRDRGDTLFVPVQGFPTGSSKLVIYHPEQVRLMKAVGWNNMARDDAEAAWRSIKASIGMPTPRLRTRARRTETACASTRTRPIVTSA